MGKPRPFWRWWLFCAALSLWWRFEWEWLGRLYSWCVLPGWLASEEELAEMAAQDGREVEW